MCTRNLTCPVEGDVLPKDFLKCYKRAEHCLHHFHTNAHPTIQFRCCQCGLEYLRPLEPHDGHGPFHPRYDHR